MKLLFFLTVTIFYETKCMVTERPKKLNSSEVKDTKHVKGVYLEDVVYALTHQNWTSEEQPCLKQTLRLLRSLQNFTLWAVWQWDSVSSQPEGILYGNRYEIGNFDECLDRPWTEEYEDLKTQYCLVDIVLERTDNPVKKKNYEPTQPYQSALDFLQQKLPHRRKLTELTWGACVPASCGPRSVQRLMETMLARSYLGMAGIRPKMAVEEPCQRADQPRKFDGLFYAFIVVIGTQLGIVLYCTYLNRDKNDLDPTNIREEFTKCFCLRSNSKALLVRSADGLDVFYGIRFLTICLIVCDHQFAMFNSGPISDGKYMDDTVLSPAGMLILHHDLFVDTYFMFSGFLTALTILKFTTLPNPIFLILKRYIRLSPAFALVVFFMCAVFPYIGSGPLWNRAYNGESVPCRNNWWLSLLMLNNYINSEDSCLVVTWYIPCDFHFFVITVLGFYVYKRLPRFGIICAGVVSVIALILPGIINYLYDFPAIQLFTYEFVTNPRGNEQFNMTYIKSHTRFAAYVIGLLAGHFFSNCKSSGRFQDLSKLRSTLGAVAGLVIMAAVMFLGQKYMLYPYHPVEGAIYAALNRPVWAVGLAMLVLYCSLGHVPLIKGFLSWYAWVPLSRLAYCLYLTHAVIILRNVMVARNPNHNEPLILLISALGVIVLGCLCAYLIWLLIEAPANNLLTLLLKSRIKRNQSKENENDINTTNAEVSGTSNEGYLHSNLPSTVQLSNTEKIMVHV